MPNYEDERSRSSHFQNEPDKQDGRASHDGRPPHIPHDQLVTHFRRFIAQEQERRRTHGFDTSPEHIIHSKLDDETMRPEHTDPKTRSQAFDFWRPLGLAWDALAYNRYDPDSHEKHLATSRLSTAYEVSKLSPQREPVIRLTRYQAGILDALTEAAGIPHQKRQTAIAIPEKVKSMSKETQERMQETWHQMCLGLREKLRKR